MLPNSLRKEKRTKDKAEFTYTVRCEPNALNQTRNAKLGGFSGGILKNNGGRKNYRDTSFSCHNSKRWKAIWIAPPHSEFNDNKYLGHGHLSVNGSNLMIEFSPRLLAYPGSGVKNLEMPLTSFEQYCVSNLN